MKFIKTIQKFFTDSKPEKIYTLFHTKMSYRRNQFRDFKRFNLSQFKAVSADESSLENAEKRLILKKEDGLTF